ncbi:MAG: L-fuconolactonase [Alphaproteobacteria bacterium]|nr:L-fuconolactonase [Alphaproteobacteria bacterium]
MRQITDQAAWLAQVKEEALEPGLAIVDPHHHLWDHPGSRYFLDELCADTASGHNVVATVFVDCGSMYRSSGPEHLRVVGETEFVNGIAAQSESGNYGPMRACAAIVGHADLTLGAAVGEVLDAHKAAAPARFRGIRHITAWDPDPKMRGAFSHLTQGMLKEKRFQEGAAELARRRMTFDSFFYHPQIPDLTEFARALPDLTIVLDHFGGPIAIGPYEGKRTEIFPLWKKHMAELAKCPNVNVKIGGINMPMNGFGWHKNALPPTSEQLAAATRDYYLHTIDVFGPSRCMFESNFPVDKRSVSYGVLWNAFKRIASGFSAADKAALFSGCASRVYGLS